MVTGLRLELAGATDTIDLTSYLPDGGDVFLARGFEGSGFPEVETFWFDGAGDGATFRGARVLPREFVLPLRVVGLDRDQVGEQLRRIARLLDPRRPAPALRMIEPSNVAWSTSVRRTGRADWAWGVDTNGATYVRFSVQLRAGDPFWERENPERFRVDAGSATPRGLLTGSLAQLNLSPGQALGTQQVTNTGDAPAYPVWTIHGPGDHFRATSPSGEVLAWDGTLGPNDVLTIDTRTGTVVDQTGANRYPSIGTAPRFWVIEPGTSSVDVALANTSPGSYTAGEVVRTNLATNPRFAATSGSATVPVARTNLLPNPSAVGRAFASGTNTISAVDTTGTLPGSAYRRGVVTATGSGTTFLHLCDAGTAGVPVTPGGVYTLSTYMHRQGSFTGYRLEVREYDAAGTLLTGPTGVATATPDLVSAWTRINGTFTVSATTAFVQLTAVWTGTSTPEVGAVVGVGATLFEAGSELKAFFRGNWSSDPALDAFWTGAANASTSIAQARGLGAPGASGLLTQQGESINTGGGGTGNGFKATIDGEIWGVLVASGGGTQDFYVYLDTASSTADDPKLLEAGRSYRISIDLMRLKSKSGVRNAGLNVTWVGGNATAGIPIEPGKYRVEMAVNIPASSTNQYIRVTGGDAGIRDNPIYFRRLLVEDVTDGSPADDEYFDGTSADGSKWVYGWSGTADASTSTKAVAKLVGQSSIQAEWRPRKWVMF